MPDLPQFLIDGALTTEGENLKAFFESAYKPAYDGYAKDAALMNDLPGHIKYYLQHVVLQKDYTPEQFFEDFRHTAAANAWRDMVALREAEEVKESVADQGSQITDLAAELTKMREEMAVEVAALKEENAKLQEQLAAKKPKGKAAKETTVTDDDTEEEPEGED